MILYINSINKYNMKGLVKLGVTPLSQAGSRANFYCVKFKQEILEVSFSIFKSQQSSNIFCGDTI